jgi:hypothetical protein
MQAVAVVLVLELTQLAEQAVAVQVLITQAALL